MRQSLNEIKNVIDKHGYSINTIICDVMKKFKFKTLCYKSGASSVKEDGYSVSEIITLLVIFPLMLLSTVNSFYKSEYNNISEMKKDVIYRLKNNEKMPWRKLLYSVCKRFQQLVNPEGIVDSKSAFILDDTTDQRTGYKIENMSIIHNHGSGVKGNSFGFKKLVLGFFDGKSISPLDFSIHSERKLNLKRRKKQYKKDCIPNSNGSKRRKECTEQKNTNGLAMIKRAVKNGFIAKYVLVDSWFSSEDFIKTVRKIKNGAIHIVCAVRRDKRNYEYKGCSLNAKKLISKLTKEDNQKRCRKWNTRYFEVTVNYSDIGAVKLFICRFPYQKEWRVFLSTDTTLNFTTMMEVYSIRWTIMLISALLSLCRFFFNADFLIFAVKTRYLYGKYRHYYFSPLSFFKISSSSAYLNVTLSLKTESSFSSSFLCA